MTDNGYHRWIHRFGISSSLLLFVAMTAFPVAISFVYGIWPDFKALWPGFVAVILFMAPYWPAETIGYMSVMDRERYICPTLLEMLQISECRQRLERLIHWELNRIPMNVIQWQSLHVEHL